MNAIPLTFELNAPLTREGFFRLTARVDFEAACPGVQMLTDFGYQRAVEMRLWFSQLYVELHDAWRALHPKADLKRYRETEAVAMWVVVNGSELYQRCLADPELLGEIKATFDAGNVFYLPQPNRTVLRVIGQLSTQAS